MTRASRNHAIYTTAAGEFRGTFLVIRKNMLIEIAESKQKIQLARIISDIAEKHNMNICLLLKEMQEAIEFYEKFGPNRMKRGIQWRGWQQKLYGYLNEKCDRKNILDC